MRARYRSFLLLFLTLWATQGYSSPLWQVQHNDATLIIGGTVHFLRQSDFPPPPAFDRAFEQADRLYLESDLGASTDPEYANQVAAAMSYSSGSLRDRLRESSWERLSQEAARAGFPLAHYQHFKPAMVSLALTLHVFQQQGFVGGIDEHYYLKARNTGKPLGYLEGADIMLRYLDNLNQEDADEVVLSTLDTLDEIDAVMEEAVSAWRAGDMDTLYSELGMDDLASDYPAIYQTIIAERHQHWLPTLKQLLEGDETVLVLVGSLHLGGPDSLLGYLQQAGYTVAPYASAGGH